MEAQAQTAETLSVRELIRELGGASAVARELGISPQAVTNWYVAGIAERHHLRLFRLAQRRGLAWRPPGAEGLELAGQAAAPEHADAAA